MNSESSSESEHLPRRAMPDAAIILAGGRSSRMGRHKPALPVAWIAMSDRVIGAVRDANPNAAVIIAGSAAGIAAVDAIVIGDTHAFAGPLAGVASALSGWQARSAPTDTPGDGTACPTPATLPDDAMVCILAGDMPFLTGQVITDLTAHVTPKQPACAVDSAGRMQVLLSAWPLGLLRTQLEAIGDPRNAPMRLLFRGTSPRLVPIADALLRDIDTPEEYSSVQ